MGYPAQSGFEIAAPQRQCPNECKLESPEVNSPNESPARRSPETQESSRPVKSSSRESQQGSSPYGSPARQTPESLTRSSPCESPTRCNSESPVVNSRYESP